LEREWQHRCVALRAERLRHERVRAFVHAPCAAGAVGAAFRTNTEDEQGTVDGDDVEDVYDFRFDQLRPLRAGHSLAWGRLVASAGAVCATGPTRLLSLTAAPTAAPPGLGPAMRPVDPLLLGPAIREASSAGF
jgi:hypothetical protein